MTNNGCALDQVVSHSSVIVEVQVQPQDRSCWIYGEQSNGGTHFPPSSSVFLLSIFPSMLNPHSLIYHRYYVMSAADRITKLLTSSQRHRTTIIYHRCYVMSAAGSITKLLTSSQRHRTTLIYHRCYVMSAADSITELLTSSKRHRSNCTSLKVGYTTFPIHLTHSWPRLFPFKSQSSCAMSCM